MTQLLPDMSSAVYSTTGHIVFARNNTLTAAPFDADTGRLTGQPFPIGGSVAVDFGLAGISIASDGTLAVRPPPATLRLPATGPSLVRVLDRSGRTIAALPQVALFDHRMAVTRDSLSAAVQLADPRTGTNDLYLVNLKTGDRSPLTSTRSWAGRPVWSPDGTRFAYANQPPGSLDDLHVQDLRTGVDTPLVQSTDDLEQPAAWSHDGRHLLVMRNVAGKGSIDIWSFETKSLTPFIPGPARQTVFAAFSPDDRYVAYTAIESDREEVVVTTFPDHKQSWPLTSDGGRLLGWRSDGHEILVATVSGHLVAYPVTATPTGFSAGAPTALINGLGSAAQWAAANADHSRIVVRVPEGADRDKGEIQLLFGWAKGYTTASGR